MALDYASRDTAISPKWLKTALKEKLGGDTPSSISFVDWDSDDTVVSPKLLDKAAREWFYSINSSGFERTYTPGTYELTVPPGVYSMEVDAVAGGGGGGTGLYGGGGSSGMGVVSKTISVTPGQVLVVTVGFGGGVGAAGSSTVIAVK